MSHQLSIQDLVGKPASPEQILKQLKAHSSACRVYERLPERYQKDFLDFCTGKTSLYLCYDSFFHYVFNTETHLDRIENLLGALLSQKIRIIEVLPRQGSQMTEKGSEVVADLLVRLKDQSLVDLEIQKYGYSFPIARMDCYCSDMIMREYNRLHSDKDNRFNFRMLHPVIAIVLMEHSPSEFKALPNTYIHRGKTEWDSGLQLAGLTRQIFVCLDKFQRVMQNKDIKTELDAWLTLLTSQDLARIDKLLTSFPSFADIYNDIFSFRTKPEELINMFSEALLAADRNMDRMMMEEVTSSLETAKKELSEEKQALVETRLALAEAKQALADKEQALANKEQALADKEQALAALKEEIRILKEK